MSEEQKERRVMDNIVAINDALKLEYKRGANEMLDKVEKELKDYGNEVGEFSFVEMIDRIKKLRK